MLTFIYTYIYIVSVEYIVNYIHIEKCVSMARESVAHICSMCNHEMCIGYVCSRVCMHKNMLNMFTAASACVCLCVCISMFHTDGNIVQTHTKSTLEHSRVRVVVPLGKPHSSVQCSSCAKMPAAELNDASKWVAYTSDMDTEQLVVVVLTTGMYVSGIDRKCFMYNFYFDCFPPSTRFPVVRASVF